MSTPAIPVFPLNTPLLPGCRLPLQIFEKRYLDMVAWCMKHDQGFVVTLLQPGSERREVIHPHQEPVTSTPFFNIGTLARIVDFGQLENGLLAITIAGGPRIELTDIAQQADGLWKGTAQPLAEFGEAGDTDLESMRELLQQVLLVHGLQEEAPAALSAEQVMNYLIMLLPISATEKQSLITRDDHAQRWQGLKQAVMELVHQQEQGQGSEGSGSAH
ncbi:MAG: LON peptidase substrate-binding domain-containing protein [Pseudomonadota bacterium]|nr:LON peptidase substrate-binding domain-containing protein [Pseudomonadota bacterium]